MCQGLYIADGGAKRKRVVKRAGIIAGRRVVAAGGCALFGHD
jgi:hypothetical protein